MAQTYKTITIPVGTSSTVDQSVTPYMRAREIDFYAHNLRPYRTTNFFFGDINVTRFVQTASQLIPDTANANSALSTVIEYGEELYCNTTHAYASAIGSANGTIYLNENYVSINVNPIGANTLTSGMWTPGMYVFQSNAAPANNGSVVYPTFEAQVVYWNSADKVLVVNPTLGTLTTASGVQNTIYTSGIDQSVYAASEVAGNKFPVNGVVSSISNTSNKFLVNTYTHNSGQITNSATAPNSNCVMVSGNITSGMVGNVIFITSGTGLGQAAKILTVGSNYVYTNLSFTPAFTGNVTYSLAPNEVDATGHVFGTFQLPETQTVNFATGSQKFTISDSTIVDDPNATMSATATYVAQGYLGTGTNSATIPTVQPSQFKQTDNQSAINSNLGSGAVSQISVSADAGPNTTYAGIISANGNTQWSWSQFNADPIAQTFVTPKPTNAQSNYGIFVSSVDLWFQSVPQGDSPKFPVHVMLTETNNGVPVANVLALTTVSYENIQLAANTPDSINVGSSIANNSTVTKFTFQDPVYLKPATTYALIVYTESPDYELWISSVGAPDISTAGGGIRRVSTQPSIGSFFKSQNAGAWVPIQNEMLMFVLNKAQFSTSPVTISYNALPVANSIIPYDQLLFNSSDLNFSVTNLTYKVQTMLANTFELEPTNTQVYPGVNLNWSADLKTSNMNNTRRRVLLPGNTNSLLLEVTLDSGSPDVTPVVNPERLASHLMTYVVNAGGITTHDITVTSGGNHINAANIVVTISPPDLPDGIQATANVSVLNGNTVPFINVTYPGTGYSVAPTITITESNAPANATAVVAGENAPSGGNVIAKYITKKIALANGFNAGDLRVWLECIRPQGTDIVVYYKVLSSQDSQSFATVPWQKMSLVQDVNSPDQATQIELAFAPALGPNGLPSGTLSYQYQGVQYPLGGTFNQYALKIVLMAQDQSVVPTVQSMRAISYPGG